MKLKDARNLDLMDNLDIIKSKYWRTKQRGESLGDSEGVRVWKEILDHGLFP